MLKCTFSMECILLQTILTNSPKMEFFEYNSGIPNVSMFLGHWKPGKYTRTLWNYIEILLFYWFLQWKICRCAFPGCGGRCCVTSVRVRKFSEMFFPAFWKILRKVFGMHLSVTVCCIRVKIRCSYLVRKISKDLEYQV